MDLIISKTKQYWHDYEGTQINVTYEDEYPRAIFKYKNYDIIINQSILKLRKMKEEIEVINEIINKICNIIDLEPNNDKDFINWCNDNNIIITKLD